MAYKVIQHFIDLQDNRHDYKEGDVYPREGAPKKATTKKRIAELSSDANRRGIPLIAEAEEEAAEE